jgi:hypothetical protein
MDVILSFSEWLTRALGVWGIIAFCVIVGVISIVVIFALALTGAAGASKKAEDDPKIRKRARIRGSATMRFNLTMLAVGLAGVLCWYLYVFGFQLDDPAVLVLLIP